ncbi:hypothetical protein CLU97_0074 [Chryseobacterium sp. 7]|nr:hypothetical protein CLU97_0074 [Chryseobacterium sp. 7]
MAGNGSDKIVNLKTVGSSTFIIPAGHFVQLEIVIDWIFISYHDSR